MRLVVAMLLLSGCAALRPPATDSERQEAAFAAFECLDRAAREFDDHHSDASTVAVAALGSCEGPLVALDEVFFR